MAAEATAMQMQLYSPQPTPPIERPAVALPTLVGNEWSVNAHAPAANMLLDGDAAWLIPAESGHIFSTNHVEQHVDSGEWNQPLRFPTPVAVLPHLAPTSSDLHSSMSFSPSDAVPFSASQVNLLMAEPAPPAHLSLIPYSAASSSQPPAAARSVQAQLLPLLSRGAISYDILELLLLLLTEAVPAEQLVALAADLPVRIFLSADSPYALDAQLIPSAIARGAPLDRNHAPLCHNSMCGCRSLTAARLVAWERLHAHRDRHSAGSRSTSQLSSDGETLAEASAGSTSHRPFLLQPFPVWLSLDGTPAWETSKATCPSIAFAHGRTSRDAVILSPTSSSYSSTRSEVTRSESDPPREHDGSVVPTFRLELDVEDFEEEGSPLQQNRKGPQTAQRRQPSCEADQKARTTVRRRRVRQLKVRMLNRVCAALQSRHHPSTAASDSAAIAAVAQALLEETDQSSSDEASSEEEQDAADAAVQSPFAPSHNHGGSRKRPRSMTDDDRAEFAETAAAASATAGDAQPSPSGVFPAAAVDGPPLLPCCACGVSYAHRCIPGPLRQLHAIHCSVMAQPASVASSSGGGGVVALAPLCACPYVIDRRCRMRFSRGWEQLFGYSEVGFHELVRQRGVQSAFDELGGDTYAAWAPGIFLQLATAPHQTATLRVRMRPARADTAERMLLAAHLEHATNGRIQAIVMTWTPEQ